MKQRARYLDGHPLTQNWIYLSVQGLQRWTYSMRGVALEFAFYFGQG